MVHMQAACWKPGIRLRVVIWLGLFATALASCMSVVKAGPVNLPAAAGHQVDFVKEIQPILSNTCYECHGALKQKGGLRLDEKAAALKGGDSGPALVSGRSAESLLILAVAGAKEDLARMPKKKEPLTPEQIGLLRGWIDQGIDWPQTAVAATRKD